jgi:hypothetical protein
VRVIFPNGPADSWLSRTAEVPAASRRISRSLAALLLAAAFTIASPARAEDSQAKQDQPPTPVPPSTPSLAGPLKANPNPFQVDGGPLGTVYISGVISGLGLTQNNPFPGDDSNLVDLSNAQVIVQTSQGPVQFYAQAGGYSIASLGTPYFQAGNYTRDTFGLLPVAYVKIAPTSDFNVIAGKLFTLQGAENAFTFQNFNIERGLLFNQTATINRGVQANYAHGPLSASLSLNDGFYSGKYNWLSGTLGYAVSPHDSITFGAASHLSTSARSSFTTPLTLNNGELYFLSWTHNQGPWTIQAYGQLQHTDKDSTLGIVHGASTYGAALLGKYSFTKELSLAARAEYIKSTGSVADGSPSLLYGPGSSAWSLTATPTWQKGIFFIRGEGSYLSAQDVVPGFGLGKNFDKHSQTRGLVEAGIFF